MYKKGIKQLYKSWNQIQCKMYSSTHRGTSIKEYRLDQSAMVYLYLYDHFLTSLPHPYDHFPCPSPILTPLPIPSPFISPFPRAPIPQTYKRHAPNSSHKPAIGTPTNPQEVHPKLLPQTRKRHVHQLLPQTCKRHAPKLLPGLIPLHNVANANPMKPW